MGTQPGGTQHCPGSFWWIQPGCQSRVEQTPSLLGRAGSRVGGARVAVVAAAERAGVAGRSRCPFLLLLSVAEVLCTASLGPPL